MELALGCVSAGGAGGLAVALMNPLDTLKVRYQVDSGASGMRRFAAAIVRREGLWRGLYAPGLAANAVAIGVSSMGRVGLYPSVRDAALNATGSEKSAPLMFGAGLAAGAAGYAASSPVFQIKTLAQAEAGLIEGGVLTTGASRGAKPRFHGRSLGAGLARLARDGALWRGAGTLTVRGAFLSAGMQVGYDGFKTAATRRGANDGPLLHALSAGAGAAGAAACSTPVDVVMVRYQRAGLAGGVAYDTPAHCALAVAREGGVFAFYRGLTPIVARLVPVFLLSMPLTEQIRRCLGLGYL